jgi:hypothetical protein
MEMAVASKITSRMKHTVMPALYLSAIYNDVSLCSDAVAGEWGDRHSSVNDSGQNLKYGVLQPLQTGKGCDAGFKTIGL